jgi:hypothetical protein
MHIAAAAAAAVSAAHHQHAANEWARSQTARTMVRAAMHSTNVVYRRTWPSQEAIDLLSELEYDPKLAWNGWLDSTLDLRDGLSVVEVFAAIDEPAALHAFAAGSRR